MFVWENCSCSFQHYHHKQGQTRKCCCFLGHLDDCDDTHDDDDLYDDQDGDLDDDDQGDDDQECQGASSAASHLVTATTTLNYHSIQMIRSSR